MHSTAAPFQVYSLKQMLMMSNALCLSYSRRAAHTWRVGVYMKRGQEALRSAMVWDLCSAILFLEDINHMKSTSSPLLQRPLFYSLGTEVISRAAAIVCIIELLTLPDKMHWESASLQAVNKMKEWECFFRLWIESHQCDRGTIFSTQTCLPM